MLAHDAAGEYLLPVMKIQKVTIIGGGVIGITTAIHLHRFGYQTELLTLMRADKMMGVLDVPEFASIFAPALIAPHSVKMEDLDEVFALSQAEFAKLEPMLGDAIRWQEHYELFAEKERPMPSYASLLKDAAPYGSSRKHQRFERALDHDISGWVAHYLFVETPVYLPFLYREYQMIGGKIREEQANRQTIASMQADVVINCTGLWSRELFNDPDLFPVRGHLMLLHDAPFPAGDTHLFSYNYTPPVTEYPYDVYFFPRSATCPLEMRGWILGGSREEPLQNGSSFWHAPEASYNVFEGIPEPVYTFNEKILRILLGRHDIGDYERTGYVGYRPGRRGGVRIELTSEFGRPVIHNYGHGGAGVTLSWGCAEKVARLIASI